MTDDSYLEWMCYASDKNGKIYRFVLHGYATDISEGAERVALYEFGPGTVVTSVEHQEPASD